MLRHYRSYRFRKTALSFPLSRPRRNFATTHPSYASLSQLRPVPTNVEDLCKTYPSAPPSLFVTPWREQGWREVLGRVPYSSITENAQESKSFDCTYELELPGGLKRKATLAAVSKDEALQLASKELVMALHVDGTWGKILQKKDGSGDKVKPLLGNKVQKEGAGRVKAVSHLPYVTELYDCCASAGSIPDFHFSQSRQTWLHSHWCGLPDGSLAAQGIGSKHVDATLRMLKSYIKRCRQAQSSESGQKPSYPNRANSLQFIAYCYRDREVQQDFRVFNDKARLEVRCQALEFGLFGTVYMDGEKISNNLYGCDRAFFKRLAVLVGAVHLAKRNPHLWSEFEAAYAEDPAQFPALDRNVAMKTHGGSVRLNEELVEPTTVRSNVPILRKWGSSIPPQVAVEVKSVHADAHVADKGDQPQVVEKAETETLVVDNVTSSTQPQVVAGLEDVDADVLGTEKGASLSPSQVAAEADKRTSTDSFLEMFNRTYRIDGAPKGEFVSPVVEVVATPEMVSIMQSASRGVLHVPEGGTIEQPVFHQNKYATLSKVAPRTRLDKRSCLLKARQAALESKKWMQLAQGTVLESLPIRKHHEEIVAMVQENTFSIVVGATGSGKTTQVPQMLFEEAISRVEGSTAEIICTQPRRIATSAAARRVAVERNETIQETVGYSTRGDSKLPRRNGSITYYTTGSLLARLRQRPEQMMADVSHIIIDEVHERDIDVDFLMVTLKDILSKRKAAGDKIPKVVLMSATLDADLFSNYFGQQMDDGSIKPCPSISIPGRTFPVNVKTLDDIVVEMKDKADMNAWKSLIGTPAVNRFLRQEGLSIDRNLNISNAGAISDDDSQHQVDTRGSFPLLCATIQHVLETTSEGAILVFLPGMQDILNINRLLRQYQARADFSVEQLTICMLHSKLKEHQDDVFNEALPGHRKVVLATNIAETSLTIPDVRYVVDSGLHRDLSFDQVTNTTTMGTQWVSAASLKQRAGRAGRVAEGHYYGIFSKARQESLAPAALPQMLRSDLQMLCLQVKTRVPEGNIAEILAKAIQPPKPEAVEAAIQQLKDMEALDDRENFTRLGTLLASLSVHPAMGKLVVLGILFRCLDPMLIVAATVLSSKFFITPAHGQDVARNARKEFSQGTKSDHVALINAFRWARSIRRQPDFNIMMRGQYLDTYAFDEISRNMLSIEGKLVDAELIPHTSEKELLESQRGPPSLNENSNNLSLIKALILAGAPKNIGEMEKPNVLYISPKKRVVTARSSVCQLSRTNQDESKQCASLYSYGVLLKTGSNGAANELSQCSPLIAALFASQARLHTSWSGVDQFILNDWLPLGLRGINGVTGTLAAKEIMSFRAGLQTILSKASGNSLKPFDRKSGRYLADDPETIEFTAKLVRLLEINDVGTENDSWSMMIDSILIDSENDMMSQMVGGE